MDVGGLRKARSGSAFLAYGTGDVRIKIFGDQDEDVDIDDGDTDTAPSIDASLAGATGGGTGVGTEAKSMVGSTLAPRVGVANVVSSTSSHGRREPHTAGSQASIGRQTLPQLTAGEDGSPKYSDGSVPKVSTEGTSKRVHANEFRIRISETSGSVRRLSSVQTLSKRKALETGPLTSTPTKRAKLHGNSCDSSDIVRKNSKTEEVQPRETALRKTELAGSGKKVVGKQPLLLAEEALDFIEFDHCCHQCNHGGELLCCHGRGCRKTFHLQCLDPPLEEVPETAFYCPSCLAKKGNTHGKGQRGKKRITYDEDATASAVFNKAQISEESERKRPRRRKGSSEEAQEVVTAPSDPVSFQQGLPSLSNILHSDSILPVTSPQVDTALPLDSTLPVTSTQVDIVLPSGSTLPLASTLVDTALTSVIPEREQLQESTDPVSFEQGLPSLSSGVHSDSTLPVTSPQVDIALPCGSSLLVTSTQVDTALPCDIPDREQLQENTDPVSFQQWLPSLSYSIQ